MKCVRTALGSILFLCLSSQAQAERLVKELTPKKFCVYQVNAFTKGDAEIGLCTLVAKTFGQLTGEGDSNTQIHECNNDRDKCLQHYSRASLLDKCRRPKVKRVAARKLSSCSAPEADFVGCMNALNSGLNRYASSVTCDDVKSGEGAKNVEPGADGCAALKRECPGLLDH